MTEKQRIVALKRRGFGPTYHGVFPVGLLTLLSLGLMVLLQSGCSRNVIEESDRPALHYALATNLADDFKKLYPKIYINGSYVFRDKLLLTPQTYRFKITYLDVYGTLRVENMQVNVQADKCYHLERGKDSFRFNIGAIDEETCSELIDQARYDLTYRTS